MVYSRSVSSGWLDISGDTDSTGVVFLGTRNEDRKGVGEGAI